MSLTVTVVQMHTYQKRWHYLIVGDTFVPPKNAEMEAGLGMVCICSIMRVHTLAEHFSQVREGDSFIAKNIKGEKYMSVPN